VNAPYNLRISQANVFRCGFVFQKLHSENVSSVKVMWFYVVSGISVGSWV